MTTAPSNDDQNDAQQKPCAAVPAHAIVMLVAGMAAAWFAAGSTGLLGHPLQHALDLARSGRRAGGRVAARTAARSEPGQFWQAA